MDQTGRKAGRSKGLEAGLTRQRGMFWTQRQRGVAAALLGGMLLVACIRLWNRPVLTRQTPDVPGPRSPQVLSRIDPNTASRQRLSILPGIGENRAKAIDAYRRAFTAAHDGQLPFQAAGDLANVKGIGRATIENLEPFLVFPADHDRSVDGQ